MLVDRQSYYKCSLYYVLSQKRYNFGAVNSCVTVLGQLKRNRQSQCYPIISTYLGYYPSWGFKMFGKDIGSLLYGSWGTLTFWDCILGTRVNIYVVWRKQNACECVCVFCKLIKSYSVHYILNNVCKICEKKYLLQYNWANHA